MVGRRLQMNMPVSLGIAVLLHLLLFLGMEMIPGLRAAWALDIPPPKPPDPLQFTFVDLPEERPEPEAPPKNARASDRTRQVAQERPPEDAPKLPDPFSVGNTEQKVDSSPSQEPPQPTGEQPQQEPGADPQPQEMFPPPDREPGEQPPDQPTEPVDDDTARKIEGLKQAVKPFSTQDLGQRYDNPGASSQMVDFGPISFDTVGIDWGPYAKEIVRIIRARWLERIPQAARMGIAGRAVISFRIRQDGGVFAIELEDGSGHRPLDKAAEYAIEASELPPLPPEFDSLGKEDVGVTFGFYYNLRPPNR